MQRARLCGRRNVASVTRRAPVGRSSGAGAPRSAAHTAAAVACTRGSACSGAGSRHVRTGERRREPGGAALPRLLGEQPASRPGRSRKARATLSGFNALAAHVATHRRSPPALSACACAAAPATAPEPHLTARPNRARCRTPCPQIRPRKAPWASEHQLRTLHPLSPAPGRTRPPRAQTLRPWGSRPSGGRRACRRAVSAAASSPASSGAPARPRRAAASRRRPFLLWPPAGACAAGADALRSAGGLPYAPRGAASGRAAVARAAARCMPDAQGGELGTGGYGRPVQRLSIPAGSRIRGRPGWWSTRARQLCGARRGLMGRSGVGQGRAG